MKTRTTAAAATLTALTALTGAGILVHQGTTVTGQGVTSPAPRTVVMAEPEPCPFPYPAAICAPIPPKPLDVDVPEDEPLDEVAAEYTAAWNEIEVGR
ncbi:hypothetical protein [Mycobacteroides abscessus]|uniref:hypothetical protein n=1 Tax=Mycobacteroides abscessus TaxID=36809 RepID=UPI0005E06DD0|nr:hypothetical protein [Mycobacteroides abscessus]CPW95060.1 Uncharacterised protein [Mycobacteroides abscessus]SKU66908.1 Uncharacterised protein [Mycobacteroides abscessus subsp. abscessus]